MNAPVQLTRMEIDPDPILNGAGVSSGATWYQAAYGANWLAGQAAVLVPGVQIDKNVAAGATGVLHFRAKTRLVAIERVWTLVLRSATPGTTATIKAPASTGAAQAATASEGRTSRELIVYREVLSAQASAVTDLTIEIAAVTGDIEIDSVTCFELTRSSLAYTADDYPADPLSMRPRERIFEGNGYQSATGVIGSIVTSEPRRVGIYQWSVPVVTPVTRAGAYTNLLTLACPVLARKLDTGDTVAEVYWSAYAKVNAGSGDVLLTTTQSSVSDSVNVTGTSFAWTTARKINISCEDMTAADGRQSSAWDDLQIQIRGNGADTLSLAAVSVWDEAAT
jgi:hypothetical protein